MILDYKFNKHTQELCISYINERGAKSLFRKHVSKFRTFRDARDSDAESQRIFTNWNGSKVVEAWTNRPQMFDILYYLSCLDKEDRNCLENKYIPKLYTWDIEVETGSDVFPEPSLAEFPITSISIANPLLDTIVLGTKPLPEGAEERIQAQIWEYINQSEFVRSLSIRPPKFKYILFENERGMLEYFLRNIVARSPVLAGWNSNFFDWQYLHNRVVNHIPGLSIGEGSINKSISQQPFYDKYKSKMYLDTPDHTYLVDYMDLVDQFDMVLQFKDSLSLDYIATQAVGIGKIKYTGDIQSLFDTDYEKYIYYNSIDSILVQLIDKRLKTLTNLCAQAQFCGIKIRDATSKIAISEAMFLRYFWDHGLVVCPFRKKITERPELVGAYVAEPRQGKHNYVCCNDFASLYPSCIQTCNLSVENFVGSVRDGTFREEELGRYRSNPNYVVTVNGSVYHNDKSYAFREIQSNLRANRNSAKYLAKSLSAHVISDVDHLMEGRYPSPRTYSREEVEKMESLGYENIRSVADLEKIEDLKLFRFKLQNEIDWLTSFEQANKYVMNSMYGGSSHVAFFWFNIDLANDITAEGRNLIHMMEKHLPEHLNSVWPTLANRFGIPLKSDPLPENMVYSVYGDTDSIYTCYDRLLNTILGIEKMTPEEKRDIILKINLEYLNGHNKEFISNYYAQRNCRSVHDFELETINYSGIWLSVKKRYAQILLWKDGKIFDPDERPLKVKGLEVIKSSYPSLSRKLLKESLLFLLNTEKKGFELTHALNRLVQTQKRGWIQANIEEICENKNINGYGKYVEADYGPAPRWKSGCPYHIKALANRNWVLNQGKERGNTYLGGKMKVYVVKTPVRSAEDNYFAFPSGEYPDWAERYFPIDRNKCFQKYYLDALNRILEGIGQHTLNIDGSISLTLNLF